MLDAKCLSRCSLAAALLLTLSACAQSLRGAPSAVELEDWAVEDSREYLIGPRDKLEINVWRQPELSVAVEVRLDGKISVPLLDDVQAEGLSAQQLKQVITKRLEEYVTAPHVTVVVQEINSKVVYMMGEIEQEGALPYEPDMRVVDAIALAGGFNDFSGKNRIKVIRRGQDGSAHEFRFDYDAYVRGTNLEQNILLLPGDRIIVPEESPFLFR